MGQTAEQVIEARDVWVWSFRSAEGLEEWSVETDMIANRDPGTLAALNRARVTPLWLVLDFGETVGLDGSTLYDPTSETAVPAALSH